MVQRSGGDQARVELIDASGLSSTDSDAKTHTHRIR